MRLWCRDNVGRRWGRKICFFKGFVDNGGARNTKGQSLLKKVSFCKIFLSFVSQTLILIRFPFSVARILSCCCRFYSSSRAQNYVKISLTKSQLCYRIELNFRPETNELTVFKTTLLFLIFSFFPKTINSSFQDTVSLYFPLLVIWMTAVDLSCCWTCLCWIAFGFSSLITNIQACQELKHL